MIPPQKVIRIIQIIQMRTKRMNMKPILTELTETFTADGLEEEGAKDKAYLTIMPKLRKDLQSIYLNRLLWIAQMKKDPIHKPDYENERRLCK